MTAYAVAHLWDVVRGDAIAEYLERIDATLAPFGGRFIVHGGAVELLEGQWPGSLVVIGFPTHEAARSWYDLPQYRAILPLRLGHARGNAILVDGVDADHRATDVLAQIPS